MRDIINYTLVIGALALAVFSCFHYITPYSVPWEIDKTRALIYFPFVLFFEAIQIVITVWVVTPTWMILQGDNLAKQGKYLDACKWYQYIIDRAGGDFNLLSSTYKKISDLQLKLGLDVESRWSLLQVERFSHSSGANLKNVGSGSSSFYKIFWIPFAFCLVYLGEGVLYLYYQLLQLAIVVLLMALTNIFILGVSIYILWKYEHKVD